MNDDDLILAAQLRREELRTELAELEAFLRTAEKLRAQFAGKVEANLTERTVHLAKSYLLEQGRPATISELYGALTRLGLEIGGKDPKSTLSARLSNSTEIISLPNNSGWWLRGHPVPSGNPHANTLTRETLAAFYARRPAVFAAGSAEEKAEKK